MTRASVVFRRYIQWALWLLSLTGCLVSDYWNFENEAGMLKVCPTGAV